MLVWAFLFSLPIAAGLFGLWFLCRLLLPATSSVLAAVRVGGLVFYLAICLLTFSPIPDLVAHLATSKSWGRQAMLWMGLGTGKSLLTVLVLALWLAVPAGWLAARTACRNLPYD